MSMRILTNVPETQLQSILRDFERILFENAGCVCVTYPTNTKEIVVDDHKVEIVSLKNLMSFSFAEDVVTLISTEQDDSIYLFLVSGCSVICPTYLVCNGAIIRLADPPISKCFYPLFVASIVKLIHIGKTALATDFDKMIAEMDYEHIKKSFNAFDETLSQLLNEHLKKELDGVFKK